MLSIVVLLYKQLACQLWKVIFFSCLCGFWRGVDLLGGLICTLLVRIARLVRLRSAVHQFVLLRKMRVAGSGRCRRPSMALVQEFQHRSAIVVISRVVCQR